MRNAALRIFLALMLLFAFLQPLPAQATENAITPCSLELEYSASGTAFEGLGIQIYRIASLQRNGNYTLISPYNQLPVRILGVTTQKEWRDTANTIAAYIASEQLAATDSAPTGADGKVTFTSLDQGIYLVTAVSVATEEHIYQFENFCVFLPRPRDDGTYDYDVSAKPKFSLAPLPEEPEMAQYKVVKLWKDIGVKNKRPTSIVVEILKDGAVVESVILNASNDWTHSWTAPVGEGRWSVAEKDVPSGYTVTITSSGDTFTITTTHPGSGEEPPKTGDAFPFRFWLSAMVLSGMLLVVCGVMTKRSAK